MGRVGRMKVLMRARKVWLGDYNSGTAECLGGLQKEQGGSAAGWWRLRIGKK